MENVRNSCHLTNKFRIQIGVSYRQFKMRLPVLWQIMAFLCSYNGT